MKKKKILLFNKKMNTLSGNIDLNKFIAKDKCTGLNIDGDPKVSGLFGGGIPVKSYEDDPELIINVFFNEKCILIFSIKRVKYITYFI